MTYYHVTPHAKTPEILSQGLVTGKPRQWMNFVGAPLGANDKIYLHTNIDSAIQFGFRLQWDTQKPVDIISIKEDLPGLEPDPCVEGQLNGWVMTSTPIPSKQIGGVIPLTPGLIKDYVAREHAKYASQVPIGMNVNDSQFPWTHMILQGQKTIETRDSDSLRPHVGERVGIVRTGQGPAMLVGYCDLGEPKVYQTNEAWQADAQLHRVEGALAPGAVKYGYPLTNVEPVNPPQPVTSQGRVFRKLAVNREEAFQAWFKGSKVVDDEGNPLVVIHQTDAVFSTFMKKYLGQNTMGSASDKWYAQTSKIGFWFASPEARNMDRMSGTTQMEVYLSLQNPVVYPTLDHLANLLEWNRWSGEKLRQVLEAEGYDGIVIERDHEVGGRSFVAFRSTQIKSVANVGTFDPKKRNILAGATVTLYHGTGRDEAESIRRQGFNTPWVYFTPDRDAALRYGSTHNDEADPEAEALAVTLPKAALHVDFDLGHDRVFTVPEANSYEGEPDWDIDDWLQHRGQFAVPRDVANRALGIRKRTAQLFQKRADAPPVSDLQKSPTQQVEEAAKAHPLKPPKRVDPTQTPEFKAWFQGSKVVNRNGTPMVVYHGSTHAFDKFDLSSGNDENYYGKGFYFTDSKVDVNSNYGTDQGRDLQSRIDSRAEELMNDMSTEEPGWRDAAYAQARKEIAGQSTGMVYLTYLRIIKPVVVQPKGGTWFEGMRVDPEDRDNYIESRQLNRLYEAALRASEELGVRGERVWEDATQNLEVYDGFTAFQFEQGIREGDECMDAQGGPGPLVARIWQLMGFDGIIMDAEAQFKNMNLSPGTKHYIVWNPRQVKSALGNSGAFNPRSKRMVAGEILDLLQKKASV